jgi:hypothetical protein
MESKKKEAIKKAKVNTLTHNSIKARVYKVEGEMNKKKMLFAHLWKFPLAIAISLGIGFKITEQVMKYVKKENPDICNGKTPPSSFNPADECQ